MSSSHIFRRKAPPGARILGWGSILIGLGELLLPCRIEKLLGLEHDDRHHGVFRVLGVRELLHGLSILTEDRTTEQLSAGLWSRVAGDVLDSALLAVAATKTNKPAQFAATSAAIAAIGAADLYEAVNLSA